MVALGFRPEPADSFARHWDIGSVREPMLAAAGSGRASDLRGFSLSRHDQLRTSSCVANATVKALEIKRVMQHGPAAHLDLSRLAVYFLAREMMDPSETGSDAGTYVSLAADAIRRFGVCRENQGGSDDKAFWPFSEESVNNSPPWLAMREAYLHKISAWYAIQSSGSSRVDDVITALAAGNPVVYGTKVGRQWQTYDGAILGVQGDIIGGHATCLVGWDPAGGFFWGENSWGNEWGPYDGFYKMSPEVVADASSSDFVVMCGGWEPWAKS